MSFVANRSHCFTRFAELIARQLVDLRSIPLSPHIEQVAGLRAFPVHEAMEMRCGSLEMLQRMFVSQVPERSRIEHIENALFASTHYQVRSRNQRCPRRVQVVVRLVQGKMVRRREPVQQLQLRSELQKA